MNWTERKQAVEAMLDRTLEEQKDATGPVSKDDALTIGYLVETADRATSEARYAKDTDEFYELRRRLANIASDVPEVIVLPAPAADGQAKMVPMAVVGPLVNLAQAIKEIAREMDGLDI